MCYMLVSTACGIIEAGFWPFFKYQYFIVALLKKVWFTGCFKNVIEKYDGFFKPVSHQN